MPKVEKEISARARKMWTRLKEWYGVRFAEQYGDLPPTDWQRVVDTTDNTTVVRGMQIIKGRYMDHPPTFPQFEQAMRPVTGGDRQPSPSDLLCKFVMKNLRLSPKQVREPWTYFGSPNGEISGVYIAADGDNHPAHRVTIDQMNSPNFQQVEAPI